MGITSRLGAQESQRHDFEFRVCVNDYAWYSGLCRFLKKDRIVQGQEGNKEGSFKGFAVLGDSESGVWICCSVRSDKLSSSPIY